MSRIAPRDPKHGLHATRRDAKNLPAPPKTWKTWKHTLRNTKRGSKKGGAAVIPLGEVNNSSLPDFLHDQNP